MSANNIFSKSDLYRSLATSNDFTVFAGMNMTPVPEDLEKSIRVRGTEVVRRVVSPHKSSTTRQMHGYMSNQLSDRHSETLIQEGLEFEEFVNYGWFNDNHVQNTSAILGFPLFVELHKHKEHGLRWYTRGCLLTGENLPDVDKIWSLAQSLHKLDRKLGLSVEGKIIQRVGPVIKRAIIRNVAITAYPVNTGCTWDIFLDAMAGADAYVKALSGDNPITSLGGGGVLIARDIPGTPKSNVYRCTETGAEFATEAELREYQEANGGKGGSKVPASLLDKSGAISWIMEQDPKIDEGLAGSLFDLVCSDEWKIHTEQSK